MDMNVPADPSVLELFIRPWALPEHALHTPETRAERLCMAGIGAIVGLFAAQNVVRNNAAVWSNAECIAVMIATGLCVGTFAAAVAALVIKAFTTIENQERTTEVQRAKRRVVFLAPLCAIVPLATWSLCSIATLCVAHHNDDPITDKLVRFFGSGIVPAITGLVTLWLIVRSQTQVRRRTANDLCFNCGYCLLNLTEPRCPECGESFDPAKTARQLRPAAEPSPVR